MLRRMPSKEIAEWQAYEHVDGPLGLVRHDYLAALVAAHVRSVMGDKKANPNKILPKWDEGPKRRSPTGQDIMAVFGGMT